MTKIDNQNARDHGGGLDAAIARFGGSRATWIDLSTGINPVPYPVPTLPPHAWASLPDVGVQEGLLQAARKLWDVPDEAAIIAAPGASSLIAQMPRLTNGTRVRIKPPTYNEHAAAFRAHGWDIITDEGAADAQVIVHPNNPTGDWHSPCDLTAPFAVIDESFADVYPERSMLRDIPLSGRVVLKSFGKFWGLAGVRLGFAIAEPDVIARLSEWLGPWAVSGPALRIATQALGDTNWADETRSRLATDAVRLDGLMQRAGASFKGGTDLFRLYEVNNARMWQDHLATHHIWTRIFPYSDRYVRLGLPHPEHWSQLENALSKPFITGGAAQ